MKILESTSVVEQFRFPRSRKQRIRAKWAKRPENFRPDLKRGYMMGDTFICHPIFAAQLRLQLARRGVRPA